MKTKELSKKKIFVRTFGCQMNVRDSEFAKGLLLESGFAASPSIDRADVILFNSCSVRKHAEDKLFSNIASLDELKKKNPGLVIGLIGCTAQNYKDKALRRAPLVDLICGPGNICELPRLIKDILKNRCSMIAADRVNEKRDEILPKYREGGFKAYIAINEGCSNFCSYCIVPYVRGRERSREAKYIIKEAEDLAARGFKEITLLGQNVNSYACKIRRFNFVDLLKRLNSIRSIERIRFMTSHPKDASTKLFRAMRDLDKVCGHLHLPLQSGSDRILKLMNRGYTAKDYLRLVSEYKKTVPGGSITTDVIVGFPSEKERDFNETMRVVEGSGFDGAFLFKYSPRPPAKSAALKDDVSEESKAKRLKALSDLQCGISKRRNAPLEGAVVRVLVDGHSPRSDLTMTGRTKENKIVVFEGAGKIAGEFVNVKIETTTPYALKGRIVK